jgi:hypothetical protein
MNGARDLMLRAAQAAETDEDSAMVAEAYQWLADLTEGR